MLIIRIRLFLFFVAMVHFVYQESHFLRLLLVFELMVLAIFIGCLYFLGARANVIGYYFCLVVLAVGVAETVLGLGILVRCSRFSGVGIKKAFNFLGF